MMISSIPKISETEWANSEEQGAPAIIPVRREETSNLFFFISSINPKNIVGTPDATVHLSRSITFSVRSERNLSIITMEQPLMTEVTVQATQPKQ